MREKNLPVIIEVDMKKGKFKAITKKWHEFVKGVMGGVNYGRQQKDNNRRKKS